MDWLVSSTMVNLRSNDCRNHVTIVAAKITVNERFTKSRDLSHTSISTLRMLGMR